MWQKVASIIVQVAMFIWNNKTVRNLLISLILKILSRLAKRSDNSLDDDIIEMLTNCFKESINDSSNSGSVEASEKL